MCANVRTLTVLGDSDTNRPLSLHSHTASTVVFCLLLFSISGRENVTNAPAVLHITDTTLDYGSKYLHSSHKKEKIYVYILQYIRTFIFPR
jgi:hypothetical protein